MCEVDPVVYSYEEWVCDNRQCCWPFTGFRALLTVLEGEFLVLGIPPAMTLAHSDMQEFLKTCDSSHISVFDTWHLSAGDSLFVSFGSVPLPLHVVASNLEKQDRGAKKRTSTEKKTNRGSFAVSLLMDVTNDKTIYPPELLSHAHSGFLRNAPYVVESVRTRVKECGYLDALDQSSAGSAQQAPEARPASGLPRHAHPPRERRNRGQHGGEEPGCRHLAEGPQDSPGELPTPPGSQAPPRQRSQACPETRRPPLVSAKRRP